MMAEVWLRGLRRGGDSSSFPLTVSQRKTWDHLRRSIRRAAQQIACARQADAIRPILDLPEEPTPTTTVERLMEALRLLPSRRLRHLMVVLYLPPGGDVRWAPWATGLVRLVALFPEVCFRFVSEADAAFAKLYRTPETIEEEIQDFLAGHREWFDPCLFRRHYRWDVLWKGHPSPPAEPLPPAFVVEDEREYAELLAYVAYRTGRYAPEIIASEKSFKRRVGISKTSHKDTLVIHAMDVPFVHFDGGSDEGKQTEQKRQAWLKLDRSKTKDGWAAGWRMAVSGGRGEGYDLVPPKEWRANEDGKSDRFAWRNGSQDEHEIRGLGKPLPWIHGLLGSGLYPRTNHLPKDGLLLATFFDGVSPTLRKKDQNGHSAPGEAQMIAELLLERARACLHDYLPVMAAILALDALRVLRGYSATLFIDALAILFAAEVRVELEVGSAAAGDPAGDTQLRIREARRLLQLLEGGKMESGKVKLLPEGMQPASLERLWTTLRQQFLNAGAFEAADEALMEIHRARAERWRDGMKSRFASIREVAVTRFKRIFDTCDPFFKGCEKVVQKWTAAYWLSDRYRSRRWGAFTVLLVTLGCWLASAPPIVDKMSEGNGPFGVALIVGVGIFAVFVAHRDNVGWVASAVRLSSWLKTAFLSVLLLTAGNLILFATPPVVPVQTHQSPVSISAVTHRHPLKRFAVAFLWTSGSTVGSETLPMVMLSSIPDVEVVFPTGAGGGDHRTLGHTLLWIEGVLTGWVLFAFGLSAIYRKAVRG